MKFIKTKLEGAYIITPEKRSDDRGFFARIWCEDEFKARGLNTNLVQANASRSFHKGTLRGMHYQLPPFAETKLVRCTKGAIYDVIIDLRPSSKTYKEWIGVELTEENHTMLYAPEGFAHGFLTLTDNAEVTYLVTAFYNSEHERGLRYNDPAFGINWLAPITNISDKDAAHPDYKESI